MGHCELEPEKNKRNYPKMAHTRLTIVWRPGVDPISSGMVVGKIERLLEDNQNLQHTAAKIVPKSDVNTHQMETDIVICWSDSTTAGQHDNLIKKIQQIVHENLCLIDNYPKPAGYWAEVDYSVPE